MRSKSSGFRWKYEMSTKHFASSCPHRKVEETNMTVHITLVTGKANSGTGNMFE